MCSLCIPNAEALGYYRPVPPGRDPRRVSNWIEAGIGMTNTPMVSPQQDYSFVTHASEELSVEPGIRKDLTPSAG